MIARIFRAGMGGMLLASVAWGAEDSPQSPDSKAIDQAIAGYTAAYNAADIDTLAACWSKECDFVDHLGRRYSGRDEIAALFRKALVDGPGYKIKLNVTARKFLRDDLAMDDGILELTEPSGETETGRYVTVWTKSDEGWQIQSVRDMPSDPAEKEDGQNPLTDLQFLVGDWVNADESIGTSVSCHWKAPGKFLVQVFKVKGESREFEVTVWIGWDPVEHKVRSWYFDTSGGFGAATWYGHEDGWKAVALGVLPDGRTTVSNFEWSQADKDTLVWKLTNAEVDAEELPDTEMRYIRRK